MVLRRLLRPGVSMLTALALGGALAQSAEAAGLSPGLSSSAFGQGVVEASAGRDALSRTVADWYRAHGFAALWTGPRDSLRLRALLRAFDTANDNGLPVSRYDAASIRARLAAARTPGDLGRLDVGLTEAYLRFAHDLSVGVLVPSRVDSNIKRHPRAPHAEALLTAVTESPNFAGFLAALAPQMPEYARLMKAKIALEHEIAAGGFGPPVPAGTLRPGDSGAAVVALRDRLIALGDLSRSVSVTFDSPIRAAVVRFQDRHGMNPDGIVGPATLAALNTPAEDRLKSVIVALERLRWMDRTPLGARHVWVNLPAFRVQLVDNGAVTFETRAIIGKADRPTNPLQLAGMSKVDRQAADTESPEFSDHIAYLDINPTWRVPHSIAVKEYLPQMQADPMTDSEIQILDDAGNVIPRDQIDFNAYDEQTFPYAMAQPPMPDNALGLVKFMFPNPYNIYLHDTPTKSLFALGKRDFSHGCIRLGDPFDFAYALLARQSADPVALFRGYLGKGKEYELSLSQRVPVHLVYFTAWPDARGGMDYYGDIYGRDAEIFAALQAAGVTPGVPRG